MLMLGIFTVQCGLKRKKRSGPRAVTLEPMVMPHSHASISLRQTNSHDNRVIAHLTLNEMQRRFGTNICADARQLHRRQFACAMTLYDENVACSTSECLASYCNLVGSLVPINWHRCWTAQRFPT